MSGPVSGSGNTNPPLSKKSKSRRMSFKRLPSLRWKPDAKAKTQLRTTINNFGNMEHALKRAIKPSKSNTSNTGSGVFFDLTKLKQEEIEDLEHIYIALTSTASEKRLKDIPKASESNKQRLAVNELWDIFKLYLDKLDLDKVHDLFKPLIMEQISTIKSIKLITRGVYAGLPDKAYADKNFDFAMKAIKLITAPKITNLLRLINQFQAIRGEDPDDLADFLDVAAQFNNLDALIGMSLTDLTGLLPDAPPPPNPDPQKVLVSRLDKQSAMRALHVNKRSTAEINFMFNLEEHDFINVKQSKDITDAISSAILRKPDVSDVRTSGKEAESQYKGFTSKIPAMHRENKARIYKQGAQNLFATTTNIESNELVVIDQVNNKDVLNVKIDQNFANQVERTVVTVPGAVANDLPVQAILVDTLREIAKTLSAVSVTIASLDETTNQVNIDNILKNAYNALHANLVPKFDKQTWIAIQQFVSTANDYVRPTVAAAETDAYTKRYRSKQFAQFLLSLHPSAGNAKTYAQAYAEFTKVKRELGTAPQYIDMRSTKPKR